GPRGRPAQARGRRPPRPRPRAGRGDARRRVLHRGRRHAARVAVAAGARADAHARLRRARDPPLRRGGDHGGLLRPRPARLALEGAAGVVTDYVVERRATRSGMPAAWWGMMILIASEGTLFAAFIGTYFYLRFQAPHWPPDGVSEPAVALPLIMVGVLLASSIPMQLGSIAARAGRLAATRFYVFVALVVQAGYFAYEAHDFANQVHRTAISVDAYTSIYYTLP